MAIEVIILILIFALLVAGSIVFVILFGRKHKLRLWIKIVIPVSFTLIATVSIFFIYYAVYYHATKEVEASLKSDALVSVKEEKDYYLFDNLSNEDKAIIFYGGAKVEEKATPRC